MCLEREAQTAVTAMAKSSHPDTRDEPEEEAVRKQLKKLQKTDQTQISPESVPAVASDTESLEEKLPITIQCSFKDWLSDCRRSNCVKLSNSLPHPKIRDQISNLLKILEDIHKNGLQHGSLSDISNYVVINEKCDIINISGTLDKSDSEKRKLEIKRDLCGFCDMLKEHVFPDPSWQESKDFLDTFDMPNNFPSRLVRIVLDHVFLKCSHGRLQMFSVIHRRLEDPSPKGNLLRNAIRNGCFKGYTDGGWDKGLDKIYWYLNNHDGSFPRKTNYNGNNICSLLSFLHLVYEHYKEHNSDVEAIEKVVRELWPGLLELLCYY